MNLKSIWSALEEGFDVLGDYGYPAMDKVAGEFELEPEYFTWVTAVWLFGSETITAAEYMRMFPYGLSHMSEERFASAAHKGYLLSDGKGGYTHTEEGLKLAKMLFRAAGDSLVEIAPIPFENLQRLFGYLDRLIETLLAELEPPPHFFAIRERDIYGRYGTERPLEDFVARFQPLSAYREDVYIATWKAHKVDGHTWEMLDFLSQHDALTFADLHDKLSRRGVTEEVHAGDVVELVGRGWAEESAGVVKATEAGKQVRAEVEAETERLFFAPWSCLNESELEELACLAGQLRDGLKKPGGE